MRPQEHPQARIGRIGKLRLAVVVGMTLARSVAVAQCVGDCNDDGVITVRELVLGAERAVGRFRSCPSADANGDGTVVVDEMVRAVSNAVDGCIPPPTPTVTATPTPQQSATPTRSPTPPSFGPQITFFGMVSASNRLLTPVTTENDVPVYRHPAGLGSGFFLVIEARAGTNGVSPGTVAFSSQDGTRPDLQILASRDLGFGSGLGSTAVCDIAPPEVGGVPGFDPPVFDPSQDVTDALNDLGCRFVNNSLDPCIIGTNGIETFADRSSTAQFCTDGAISRHLQFPRGDTLLVAQWRDFNGTIGNPVRIVIRVD